jgi:3-hydroxybutyrate dehydrogenase
MAIQLSGKTALVTGGGSGICLAFTQALLAKGCNVVVADLALTPEADEAFRPFQSGGDTTTKPSPGLVFVPTDVTDWKQLRRAFDTAIEHFHALDVVCPGAGIFEPVSPFLLASLAR